MQDEFVSISFANEWNFVSAEGSKFNREILPDRIRLKTIVQADPFNPAKTFKSAIPSWNGSATNGAYMEIRLQPSNVDAPGFILARWSEGPAGKNRTSINNQKNLVGRVDTDTLILAKPVNSISVTVDCFPGNDGRYAQLDRFHLILGGGESLRERRAMSTWNTLLDVPYRAQAKYVGGGVLCSPTAVSMILGYWADKLNQPGLDFDVPDVQRGVFDPGWDGTGNWPFNVAFAGSLPGMTGYVTQLRDIGDIEDFVASGVPIATSVSYDLLKGKSKKGATDGHLVVVVGFDPKGQPIINDPGRNVVRMVYDRNAFARAWASSSNTVYVIHPLGWNIPSDGPWPNKIELK